jgi:hypothetical protein
MKSVALYAQCEYCHLRRKTTGLKPEGLWVPDVWAGGLQQSRHLHFLTTEPLDARGASAGARLMDNGVDPMPDNTEALDALATKIKQAHMGRVRNNLTAAIELGRDLQAAFRLCRRSKPKRDWTEWVDGNCGFKQASADRYRLLFRRTDGKPERIEEIVAKGLGLEDAASYLSGLDGKSKKKSADASKDEGKKDANPSKDEGKQEKQRANTIDGQLAECSEAIKAASAKIEKELPLNEWTEYLEEIDSRPASDYFTGKAKLPVPPRVEKTIRQARPAKEFRPGA